MPIRELDAEADGRTQREVLAEQLDSIPDRLAPGGTGLYDTTLAAVRAARENFDPTAVNSVLVLTDGTDEDDDAGLGSTGCSRPCGARPTRSARSRSSAWRSGPTRTSRRSNRSLRRPVARPTRRSTRPTCRPSSSTPSASAAESPGPGQHGVDGVRERRGPAGRGGDLGRRVTGVGTRIPTAPAAVAASASAATSPMTTQRAGSTPNSAQAAVTMPGAGLRQAQPSSGPCGQTWIGVERAEQLGQPGHAGVDLLHRDQPAGDGRLVAGHADPHAAVPQPVQRLAARRRPGRIQAGSPL